MDNENSRINLIIQMPDDKEQYQLIESYIKKLTSALSPDQVNVWETQMTRDTALEADRASAFLLYLSHRHFSIPGMALPPVTFTFLNLKNLLETQRASATVTAKELEQAFVNCLLNKSPKACVNPYITQHAVAIISEQYKKLSLESLAGQLHINHSYLCRVLSKDTGCSFLDLLHTRRILAAVACFLEDCDTAPPLEELAFMLGYTSLHYFHRAFKRYTRLTPAGARRLLRQFSGPSSAPP